MNEKDLVKLSKIVSTICSPFYMPIVGLLALFTFSYLSLLHWEVKLYIFIIILLFTIMLPTTLIRFYQRYEGWSKEDLKQQDKRTIPFVICIFCYFWGYYTLSANHVPYTIRCIIIAALLIQVICAIINKWWHISTHSAAIGGVLGAIVAFAEVFSFNPTWWICIVLLIAGLVGTSRMVLKRHTLGQVVGGFLIGIACSILAI